MQIRSFGTFLLIASKHRLIYQKKIRKKERFNDNQLRKNLTPTFFVAALIYLICTLLATCFCAKDETNMMRTIEYQSGELNSFCTFRIIIMLPVSDNFNQVYLFTAK